MNTGLQPMQVFKKCPHCGSGVWVIPHEEPNCEVCGCDTDVLNDDLNEVDLQIANLQQEKVSIAQNLTRLFQDLDSYNKNKNEAESRP